MSLKSAIKEIEDMSKAYQDLKCSHFSISLSREDWKEILKAAKEKQANIDKIVNIVWLETY